MAKNLSEASLEAVLVKLLETKEKITIKPTVAFIKHMMRRGDILRCIETDELCAVWATSTSGKTMIKWAGDDFGSYTADQIGELFWLEPKEEEEMTEIERQLDLLLGDALSENERLKRALKYQDDQETWVIHGPDCWSWGPKHYECALRHIRGSND